MGCTLVVSRLKCCAEMPEASETCCAELEYHFHHDTLCGIGQAVEPCIPGSGVERIRDVLDQHLFRFDIRAARLLPSPKVGRIWRMTVEVSPVADGQGAGGAEVRAR